MSPKHPLPALRVLPADAVSRAAAEHIATVLADAVAGRGIAHWATTGGSVAPAIYAALAAPPLAGSVDWTRVRTWWGDDRFVRHDDPLSNVWPIGALALPVDTVHPVPTEAALDAGEDAAWAAARYAEEMAAALPTNDSGDPVFDLVVLGVGPDGHILSVFPGSAAWDEAAPCVAVPAPTHIGPHVDRVTLHPRLVGAARSILVVAAGSWKAASLARAWTGDDVRELPVRAARLATATWILDGAAAAELQRGRPRT